VSEKQAIWLYAQSSRRQVCRKAVSSARALVKQGVMNRLASTMVTAAFLLCCGQLNVWVANMQKQVAEVQRKYGWV
jgi:hypothetical protein